MKIFLKPAVIGFMMFAVLLSFIVVFYTSSNMKPIFGTWELEKNGNIQEVTFPVNEHISEDGYMTLRKTFTIDPIYDRITFTVYPFMQNANVYIDGNYVFKIDTFEEMEDNLPPFIFLTYKIPQRYINKEITLEILTLGPQDIYIGYYPMLSNAYIVKNGFVKAQILESYIYIFAVGLQVMIAFLMITICMSTRSKNKAYLFIGFGTLLQIPYLMHSVLAFNLNFTIASGAFTFLLPLILISSFTLIYQGLELFITNRLKHTIHFWKALPFIVLFYLFVPLDDFTKHQITMTYFLFMTLFMIYTSIKHGKNEVLTYSLFLIFFTSFYDFYLKNLISVFPMPSLQTYSIIALNFIFGSFFSYNFINSYKRERKLRIELSESYEEIHTSNEELETSYLEIEELNNSLEERVRERTEELDYAIKDLKMILDNTEEGFLTLDKLQRAESTYSAECERIFDTSPAGKRLSELLYPEKKDYMNADFVDELLIAIQEETDELRRQSYISLLPDQLMINGLYTAIEYKWIEDAIPGEKQLMVILKDISSKIELENRIELERNNLSKIVKIMLNLEEFMRIEADYRQFMNVEVFKNIDETISFNKSISFIKRRVHTFKGNLASFGLIKLSNRLHELEDKLAQLMLKKELDESEKIKRLKDIFSETDTIGWLSEEEELIKNDVSTDIFKEERFHRVYPEQLNNLKANLESMLPDELLEPVRCEVQKIEHRSLKELLNYYRFVVENLSEKLGKTISPLKIRGNNYYVDPGKFEKWINSLIHLFRNSIDHGIENADERIVNGKSEYGQITVDIRKNNSVLKIEISDDGRGLNINKLISIALQRGLKTEAEIKAMKEQEIIELIFVEGFSTKEKTSLISGRGVGLSTVKHEWEQIGGTLQIQTEKDKGTKFIFIFEES